MATDGTPRNPEPTDTQAVAPKVKWGAIGSTAAGLGLSLLAAILTPDEQIISGLPDYVVVLLAGLVPGLSSLAAGYSARHQWRVRPGAQGGAGGSTQVG